MIRAVVFDLDGTLANTAELKNGRREPYDVLKLSPPGASTVELRFGDGREWLPGYLASNGYRVGIVTNSPPAYASTLLDLLLVDFERLLAGSKIYESKAKKLVALSDDWGIATDAILYVGDLPEDQVAAKMSGCGFLRSSKINLLKYPCFTTWLIF